MRFFLLEREIFQTEKLQFNIRYFFCQIDIVLICDHDDGGLLSDTTDNRDMPKQIDQNR